MGATECRFDICEAWYCYASDYHGGQSSKLYSKFAQLDRIEFRPAPNLSYDTLIEKGKEIYDQLVNSKKYQ